MKKKCLFLGLAMLLSMASAFAQSGTAGPLTWKFYNGKLTISGEGAMPDYGDFNGDAPWREYSWSIRTIVIETGVTSIGNHAFYGCGVKSITISNSVTSIGEYAFYACMELTSITIPDGVITIGRLAFSLCTSLTSVFIPNSVTDMGYKSFDFCKSLTSITLSDEITSIGYATFSYCENLVSITLPENLKNIGNQAFEHCTSLTSIIIPDRVKNIEKEAFRECTSLTSLTLPAGLAAIGDDAFFACKNLNLITNFNLIPIDVYPTVFYGVDKSACTLEVAINSVSAYKNANTWKEFNIVGIEVGIETIEPDVVKIYPNPTDGQLKIENEKLNIENVEIYDVMGRKAPLNPPEGGRLPSFGGVGGGFDISHLPSGIYFIRIQTETGTVTRKIVKK